MLIVLAFLVAATLVADRAFHLNPPIVLINTASVSLNLTADFLPFTSFNDTSTWSQDSPHTSQTTTSSLTRRALVFNPNDIASDAVWQRYIEKGEFYQCLFECTDRLAGKGLQDTRTPPSAESIWQGDLVNELATWGWIDGEYSNAIHADFRNDPSILNKNKIEGTFTHLALDPLPAPAGPNVCFSIEHNEEPDSVEDDVGDYQSVFSNPISDQKYIVGNQQYTQTGGHYRFGFNRRGGAIFAQYLKKPAVAAAENWGRVPAENELPQLHRASDIIWAYWVRDNPEPSALQYYLVNHVQNTETLPLIARIVRRYGIQQIPYWSTRITMGSSDESFNAILGSPLGSTIAHLLLQHKSVLGHKHVMQIHLFRDNRQPGSDPQPQLLFWIGDLDPDEINDDNDTEMRDALRKRGSVVEAPEQGSKNIVRVHKINVNAAKGE